MGAGRVLTVLILLTSCDRTTPERTNQSVSPPAAAKPGSYPSGFWERWGDRETEVSTYNLVTGRSKGSIVAIFGVERFSNTRRVATRSKGADTFPVMKMNLTGQTSPDAREMLSVFVALAPVNDLPTGATTKVSFSRQSWLGHEWGQLLMNRSVATHMWSSFREEEADGRQILRFPPDLTVPEDALPLCARRIAHPVLRLGQTMKARSVSSLSRIPLEVADVELSLSEERRTTRVPAGSFRTHSFTARWRGGATRTWDVETEPPHRIIRWQTSNGEMAELTGSALPDPVGRASPRESPRVHPR